MINSSKLLGIKIGGFLDLILLNSHKRVTTPFDMYLYVIIEIRRSLEFLYCIFKPTIIRWKAKLKVIFGKIYINLDIFRRNLSSI